MDPTVRRVAPPRHPPLLFHAVEVVRQGRSLDPSGLSNLALARPGMRFERDEHHPCGLASPLPSEDCVELLSHQLGGPSEISPERFLRWPLHVSQGNRIVRDQIL